jgi:hypothetical protein
VLSLHDSGLPSAIVHAATFVGSRSRGPRRQGLAASERMPAPSLVVSLLRPLSSPAAASPSEPNRSRSTCVKRVGGVSALDLMHDDATVGRLSGFGVFVAIGCGELESVDASELVDCGKSRSVGYCGFALQGVQ